MAGYWKTGEERVGKEFDTKRPKETIKEIQEYPFVAVPERGIRKETCEKFGVRAALSEADGKTVVAYYFPYYDQTGKLAGYKKRDMTLDKHEKYHFTTIGQQGVACKLFGQDVAEAIPRRHGALLYSEGEWDVMSNYQVQLDSVKGTKWEGMEPFCVGLSCGTGNAVEATLHNIDFIKSFDSLTFNFDPDSATPAEIKKGMRKGIEARNEVANALIGTGVALHVVDLPTDVKDSSDMLQLGRGRELARILQFDKRPYSAEKIIKAGDIPFEDVIAPRPEGIHTECFPEFDEKIHGFRKRELVLLTSPSGVGKSTVTSIFANKIEAAGEKVGMIYLEETNKETLQRIVASRLKVNYNKFKNNPLDCASVEEIRRVYDEIVKDDKVVMLGHFGSLPISELMSKIKHMHFVEHCGYIILDHLSVVISGSEVENERKELDMVMTELAAFCAANDVGIIAVSHINRSIANDFRPPKGEEDKPFWVKVTKEMMRGSGALEQLSFIIIGLEPQILPDRGRGKVRLTVLKNRPWGYLGVCDTFEMDDATWEVLLDAEGQEF